MIDKYVVVNLHLGERDCPVCLYVAGIGRNSIILGFPWLKEFDPIISWSNQTLSWRPEQLTVNQVDLEEELSTTWHAFYVKRLLSSSIRDSNKVQLARLELEDEFSNIFLGADEEDFCDQTNDDLDEDTMEMRISQQSLGDSSIYPKLGEFSHDESAEGEVSPDGKVYKLSPEETQLTADFIKEHEAKGYIQPSKSPQASSFFFVAKADGKKRPCQDYRWLNNWTIKNAYPLPNTLVIMDKVRDARYFTKFDIRWGYNNIRIKKGHEWKAAFITPFGLYEPTVMFFGLCNLPATFQAMMDSIFAVELQEGWLVIYMDDILIFSDNLDSLDAYTIRVLDKLQKNDLFLKPEKCSFAQTSIEYLGHIISKGVFKMSKKKIQAVLDWPTPTTLKQVRSFVGFGNFYQHFIQKYSEVTRPLNDLMRKDVKFEWNSEAQQAFEELKRRFTEEPILLIPDSTKPFAIESDASKYASGAVLLQDDPDGRKHPVAFLSKSFSATERNYEIYDRELLAIIRALEEWRHYIQGSSHTTTIYSDHKNLTYWRQPQNLNRRQARWHLQLSEYDLKLVHIPGNKMIQSNTLSRRPDLCPNEDHDNENVTMLSDDLFVNVIDTELQKAIVESEDYDEDAADALTRLKSSTVPIAISDDWTVEYFDNKPLLFYQGKAYIPKSHDLRRDIVQRHHDSVLAGHPGELETFNKVRANYWWPGLRTFVRNYVKGCATCQEFKIDRHPSKPSLVAIEGSKELRPFAQLSMDFLTDLPPSNGFDTILSVVDHGLTKGVVLIPTTKKGLKSADVAQLLIDNVVKRFGIPTKIISDRDVRMAVNSYKELWRLLGTEIALSSAYHPITDGTTERYNQEIECFLAIFCLEHPDTWSNFLPIAEFVHNDRRHSDREHTPFELMFGISPPFIPQAFEATKFGDVEERLRALATMRKEAVEAHILAKDRISSRIKSKFTPFKKGDQVFLSTKYLKMLWTSRKLSPKKAGPFKITEVLGPVTYRLKLPPQWKIHNAFHASLLSCFEETEEHGPAHPHPPPDIMEEEEEYEPEAILKHRGKKPIEYYVKWKGYPHGENTWETASQFTHSRKLLRDYQQKHKLL
ncbi:unnamed protein product [Cyclocybe aegerita]|uniref:RNA-directed DNA polymerase n=1 Tax=Cyclocybe aegerita TaxID=1973307 RepID=A0A8S0WAN3_CYCAE|nr:unnamed protein product [Cyclocybe aegerita]